MFFVRFYRERAAYPLRLMASLAFTLGLLLLLIHAWPSRHQVHAPVASNLTSEVIALEIMVPTRQARSAPPPPAPPIPVVVPEEVLLEEIDITQELIPFEGAGTGQTLGEEAAEASGAGATRAALEIGPKPIRFVEPEYTREARRARIRAEIVVEVQVTASGEVQRATVVERYLLFPQRQAVDTIGYGLEAAALAAARNWRFRPAIRQNRPVSSTTRITFTFGQ